MNITTMYFLTRIEQVIPTKNVYKGWKQLKNGKIENKSDWLQIRTTGLSLYFWFFNQILSQSKHVCLPNCSSQVDLWQLIRGRRKIDVYSFKNKQNEKMASDFWLELWIYIFNQEKPTNFLVFLQEKKWLIFKM